MSQPAAAAYSVTYKRDMLNRIVGVGRPGDDFAFGRYGYNGHGNVATEELNASSPTARIARQMRYDALGNLIGIEDPFATYGYSYRANGADTGPYLDGSLTAESTRFNAAGFAPGQAPRNFRYDYVNDPFARLRSASASDPDSHAPLAPWNVDVNAYDADNSILALTSAGQRYDYERANDTHRVRRIVATPAGATRTTYSYDAYGSVSRVAGATTIDYEYDPFTKLPRRAEVKGGPTVQYSMTADGHRAIKSVRTAQGTRTALSLGIARGPYVELTRAGGPETSRRYIWGPLGLLGIDTGTDTLLLARDRLGSVRVAASAQSGKAAAWFNYLPYGDNMPGNCGGDSGSVDAVKYRYTGQEWEPELGLYNYGARLYESGSGLFHTVDPIHETPNPYAYVRNDPLNRVDPTGLMSTPFNMLAGGALSTEGRAAAELTRAQRAEAIAGLGLDRVIAGDPAAVALARTTRKWRAFVADVTRYGLEDMAEAMARGEDWEWDFKNFSNTHLVKLFYRHRSYMWRTDYGVTAIVRLLKWAFRVTYATSMGFAYAKNSGIKGGAVAGAAFSLGALNFGFQFAGDRLYQLLRRKIETWGWLRALGPYGLLRLPTAARGIPKLHIAMRVAFPVVHLPMLVGEAFARTAVLYAFNHKKDWKYGARRAALLGGLNVGIQWAVSGGRAYYKITRGLANKAIRQAMQRTSGMGNQTALMSNVWTNRAEGTRAKIWLRVAAEGAAAAIKLPLDLTMAYVGLHAKLT